MARVTNTTLWWIVIATPLHNYAVTPDDKRAYCWVQNADGEEYLGYFDLKEI